MNLLSKDPMYEAFGQRMMQMHYFCQSSFRTSLYQKRPFSEQVIGESPL
jgi:hypothetical protein